MLHVFFSAGRVTTLRTISMLIAVMLRQLNVQTDAENKNREFLIMSGRDGAVFSKLLAISCDGPNAVLIVFNPHESSIV